MARQRFPLSSDQFELLLAFERNDSLGELSKAMAKDPSVVSRNLQKLADGLPVIEKVRGRWQLTPLGSLMNEKVRAFLAEIAPLLRDQVELNPHGGDLLGRQSVLLVINAQAGLTAGLREDQGVGVDAAKANVQKILHTWRGADRPVIHVRHLSENPRSRFFKDSPGAAFDPNLSPERDETVVEKRLAGAFAGTDLLDHLDALGADSVVIAGFTANECIDATARQAQEHALNPVVIGDATASFDIRGRDGKIVKAERIHALILENLNALCARVIDTETLMRSLHKTV